MREQTEGLRKTNWWEGVKLIFHLHPLKREQKWAKQENF